MFQIVLQIPQECFCFHTPVLLLKSYIWIEFLYISLSPLVFPAFVVEGWVSDIWPYEPEQRGEYLRNAHW